MTAPARWLPRLALAALAAAIAAAAGSAWLAPAAPAATDADRALYERLSAATMSGWDAGRGGFVAKDTRPDEDAVELMLARGRDGDSLARARGMATLGWMHQLLDTVGGGYVNTLRDADPTRTGFDKETIPNARRLELLAFAATAGDARARRDGAAVADYAERVLLDPRGGFVSGQAGSRDLVPEVNGVALQAWLRWGALTGASSRRDFAWKSLARLWRENHDPALGFLRRNDAGQMRGPALLADQVEMGRAYLFSWAATGRDSDLARARAIADDLHAHFVDAEKGGFHMEYGAERFGHAAGKREPFADNARAARFLAELASAAGDSAYADAARRTWAAAEKPLAKAQLDAAPWALAVRALWSPDLPPRASWVEPPKHVTPQVIRIGRIRK